ncbi:radical SAM protein [Streptobacillus moniliformis]|uniref:radical SAM/SPASM domain-containing protein n=2 Tax=Streptobacillus moniliformis TaxID=34105 RepID=UPI0007E37846|nr:radical SAM protein [Streptobacillus moniliformis]QXW66268.1 radical SAM protein [Streptobacillus moniliformis]
MYKVSNYNIVKIKKNDEVTILNTVTGKKINCQISDEIYNKLMSKMNFTNTNDNLIKKLYLDGFLVDANENEFEKVEEIYNYNIFDNNLEFTIIITDGCNFKCAYCYQEDREYKIIKKNILISILKYIEKNSKKYKTIKINWFGGEPMLGFKKIIYFMEKCIEICKKNKISLVSGMTTNGYLLTLDNFKKLLKCKVFLFQITLDGPREIHNKLRPHKNKQDSFEVIIDNLRKINFEIKQYYSIVLRINLTKATVNNFTKFMNELKFLKRNNKINFNCQKMSNYGGESINKLIDEMITEEDFANIHSTLVENNFNIINQPLIKAGAGLCSSCKKNSYYIDPDGNVLKCSLAIYNFKFKEKNIIGYIKEDGEIFIKNDIENQWIKRNKLDNECKHCKFYPICYNHYCPYRRMIKNKKICYGYKNFIFNSL